MSDAAGERPPPSHVPGAKRAGCQHKLPHRRKHHDNVERRATPSNRRKGCPAWPGARVNTSGHNFVPHHTAPNPANRSRPVDNMRLPSDAGPPDHAPRPLAFDERPAARAVNCAVAAPWPLQSLRGFPSRGRLRLESAPWVSPSRRNQPRPHDLVAWLDRDGSCSLHLESRFRLHVGDYRRRGLLVAASPVLTLACTDSWRGRVSDV